MTPRFPILCAAALLALAGCSKEPASDAGSNATAPVPDVGRGRMLTQRADAIERRIAEGTANGSLPAETAQAASVEVAEARRTLAEFLARTPGPLPQADRQLVAERLAAVEARLDGAGGAAR